MIRALRRAAASARRDPFVPLALVLLVVATAAYVWMGAPSA